MDPDKLFPLIIGGILAVVFFGLFASAYVDAKNLHECRIAAITAKYPATEIRTICLK